VIRDPEVRARAIAGAEDDVKAAGLVLLGTCDSSLEGPKGNLEAFVHARKP
jgi:23S rRNA (cytidine1920-2'-O)/16S rRNA (cytidine1409-2'-O)-methyltransferase